MSPFQSRIGRLLTAIGVGLLIEILLFAGGTVVGLSFQHPWDERIWAATQEPSYHLVDWLARVQHPGFEQQGAYVMLIPLSQWLMWSAVSCFFVSRRKRKPVPLTVE